MRYFQSLAVKTQGMTVADDLLSSVTTDDIVPVLCFKIPYSP